MRLILSLVALSLIFLGHSARVYNVTARRYDSKPLIANASTGWQFNYNAALYDYQGNMELIVRCQNLKNKSNPFDVGPSYLSSSHISFDEKYFPSATQPTTLAFIPDNTTEACGTEDPRITYNDGLYYLFYTAYNCTNAMLSLAVSEDPAVPGSWKRYGYVFPEKTWSKSGAALFANKENNLSQHYLFWGDSSYPQAGIGIATSNDSIHWTDTGKLLLQIRNDSFDSNLVESGPSPLRLSSGDFLFIYNSARHGYPSVKPAWDLQYNIGFAILSANDPLNVIQRSDSAILSPELEWEVGNTTDFLTPVVVFLEGLLPDPKGCTNQEIAENPYAASIDCFFGVYGGADTHLGSVRIVVTSTENFAESEGQSTQADEFLDLMSI